MLYTITLFSFNCSISILDHLTKGNTFIFILFDNIYTYIYLLVLYFDIISTIFIYCYSIFTLTLYSPMMFQHSLVININSSFSDSGLHIAILRVEFSLRFHGLSLFPCLIFFNFLLYETFH